MSLTRTLLVTTLILGLGAGWAFAQTPLSTGFTYQGRLQLSGNPVSATADFQFTLWDQAGSGSPPSGGSQYSATFQADSVTVSAGLFTTGVDFGAPAFNGDARWLQIAVRSPSGSGTFQTLSPRQPLTATPYASQTRGIFVSADEKVGIGTTAPLHPLHVFDPLGVVAVDSTFNSWFYAMKGGALKGAVGYRDANGGATGGLTLFEGGVGDVMVIRDGNVGIGTTTPANKLSLVGNADVMGNVGIGTSSPNGRLTLAGLGDGVDAAASGLVFRGADDPGADFSRAAIWALGSNGFNGSLVFGTDGDGINNHNVLERMRIAPNGYVGIGTAAPLHALHVFDPLGVVAVDSTVNSWFYAMKAGSLKGAVGYRDANGGATGGLTLFESGVGDVMVIRDGKVGIGTTSPTARLHLKELSNFPALTCDMNTTSFVVRRSGVSGETVIENPLGDLLLNNVSGNVGVGFTYSNVDLTVHNRPGNEFILSCEDSSGDHKFVVQSNGLVATDCGVLCLSDARLKTNICQLDDAVEHVRALRGVSFEWRDPAAFQPGPQIGFIAQELEQVLPELVHTDKEGFKSLNYANLTAVLVEAIKELAVQVEDLRGAAPQPDMLRPLVDRAARLESTLPENAAELNALRQQNAELEGRIKRLERMVDTLAKR